MAWVSQPPNPSVTCVGFWESQFGKSNENQIDSGSAMNFQSSPKSHKITGPFVDLNFMFAISRNFQDLQETLTSVSGDGCASLMAVAKQYVCKKFC